MSKNLVLAPVGDINGYIQTINKIPPLTLAEELQLARELHQQKNLNAAKQLIMANLRYVVKIAYMYKGYGLNLADLIQEGTIGLMKAVKRFDPEQGVRLITFASQWIKAEIHEFIMRNWRIVKIVTTKAQRKLFFNLRKNKKHAGWLSQDEAKSLSSQLAVDTRTLQDMEVRMAAQDTSFDIPNSDDDSLHPVQTLEDQRYEPSRLLEQEDSSGYAHTRVNQALSLLDERSRIIIQRRWLNEKKSTLNELADQFNVSAERVRQLEKAALDRIKGSIK